MHKDNIKDIIEKLENGNLSSLEESKLKLWLFQFEKDKDFEITDERLLEVQETVWARLNTPVTKEEKKVFWSKWAVAASVLFLLLAGMLTYFIKSDRVGAEGTVASPNDLIITLSDGEKIKINKHHSGEISSDEGVKVMIDSNGMIIYQLTNTANSKVGNHEISTGRENAKIKLADGSIVILNSQSSLSYPIQFLKESNRQVSLKGEGYFEVASNPNSPFVVLSNKQKIEVIGTKFNVNTYNLNKSITTLAEGKIKISNGKYTKILYPGEEAYNDGDKLEIKESRNDQVLGWMEGNFVFSGLDIESVMKQLELWYNVKISYDKNIDGVFYGNISKQKSIDEVLGILSETNDVKYKIEGRLITITK